MRASTPTVVLAASYREVFDEEPSLDIVRRLLQPYRRSDVLLGLSWIGVQVRSWHVLLALEENAALMRLYFPSEFARHQEQQQNRPANYYFTRLGILTVAKVTLQYCDADGQSVSSAEDIRVLLRCCIMMNDLTAAGGPLSEPVSSGALLSASLPLSDSAPQALFASDAARSLGLFAESGKPGLRTRADAIDLGQEFENGLGISPTLFAQLALAVAGFYYHILGPDSGFSIERTLLPSELFANFVIPEASIQTFWERVAINEEQLVTRVKGLANRPLSDIVALQASPLVRRGDGRIYCLDVAFLIDKPGRGLMWTLMEFATAPVRKRLLGFYGAVFESYLNSRAAGARLLEGQTYVPGPSFRPSDEAFDGCWVEGASLVVCEYKSSVLTAPAKYGGDPDLLVREIQKKFVEGDKDGAKGISQLVRGIERFLKGEHLPLVPRPGVVTIFPVMVVLDRSMTSPFMSRYLNKQFPAARFEAEFGVRMMPLFVIDVENYERLIAYSGTYKISDLLQSYYGAVMRKDGGQLVPLRPENIPLLTGPPPGGDPVLRMAREFGAAQMKDLFGRSLTASELETLAQAEDREW